MTNPYVAQDVDLASLTQRIAAQFIDGLVVGAPALALVYGAISFRGGSAGSSAWPAGVLFAAAVLFAMLYVLFSDGLRGGQSLGSRLVGIRVVSAESRVPCTFWQSFVRNLLLSILGPIDWIFVFGERRQRLGDMAAGTIVIVD